VTTVTVIGQHGGREARISWTDGALEGPEPLVRVAHAAARAGADVSPPGLARGPASLEPGAHPETVAATLAVGLDRVTGVEGLPEPERLPDDAVA
jgi:hypothetical protein